jgi:hypothetical protein
MLLLHLGLEKFCHLIHQRPHSNTAARAILVFFQKGIQKIKCRNFTRIIVGRSISGRGQNGNFGTQKR